MQLRDALRTTGAVREFEDRAVPRALLYDVLEAARFSPSGGNRQGWRVISVEDAERRRALRDAYLPGWYEYLAQAGAGLVPFSPANDRAREAHAMQGASELARDASGGAGGFAEHLDEVPVLLLVVADLRHIAAMDRDAGRYPLVAGASVYPFCWSVLLAAHDAGLGGVLTTMVRRRDADVRERFGLAEHDEVAALLALGWPTSRATRLRRAPVEQFAHVDSLDGPPLTR
jgi:nitroreductase